MAFALPEGFGLAGLVAIEYMLILLAMAMKVGGARKKYNVPYPDLYATVNEKCSEKDARTFNCMQRGHQNSLENVGNFLVLHFIAALSYPLYSAIAGQIYVVGRIAYFYGYCTGDPKKRLYGEFMYVGQIAQLIMAVMVCIEML